MKLYSSLFLLFSTLTLTTFSQNLYTLPNAANITNEVNAITGWSGPATEESVTGNPQSGTYSIRITTNSNGNRHSGFNFTATAGTVYNISIWARRGSSNSNSAFANWQGFSGFTETSIPTTTWQEFTFTLTATSSSPQIRVYAATGGPAGRVAFVDAITITAQAGDTEPPTAPTGLAASNTTSSATTLNWNASTDNVGVTSYQIRRDNVNIGTVSGTTLTYNATGLTASTTYSFNVVALDAAGNISPPSNTIQVTTLSGGGDTEPPTAPTNLTASNTTSSATTLNWNASTDNVGVTSYQIRRNNVTVGTVGGTTLTYNATGLTASTTYSFNVVALDAAGNISPPSNTIQVTTLSGGGDTEPPTAPTNLTASNTTSSATTLNWNASTDNVGVTSYQIRRNNVTVGTVGGTTLTYNATGLTASTTYSFNVVALDAAGNISPPSNTVQVTTLSGGDTQPPTAPSNLAASNTTTTATTLNWSASTDNVGVNSYQIRQNNVTVGTVSGTTLTYTATGLTASTTYSFNVVALDAAGNVSTPSNTIQVTTLAGGSGTPYTSENANLPTVNWQAQNLYVSGTMGIGTAAPDPNNFRLAVNGDIRVKELLVESGWSDFVFLPDYDLLSIKELEEFIIKNGHLKDIPSASYVQENGIGLSEINMRLLQKVEELTLYIIELNKKLTELEKLKAGQKN